jgi:hypothetical protein
MRRPRPISAHCGLPHFNGKDRVQSGERARYSAPDCDPVGYCANRIRIFRFSNVTYQDAQTRLELMQLMEDFMVDYSEGWHP